MVLFHILTTLKWLKDWDRDFKLERGEIYIKGLILISDNASPCCFLTRCFL